MYLHFIHYMFFVEFTAPYTGAPRSQEFRTQEEAQRQAAFYRSCGTPATVTYRALRSK